jgi:chemotaxis methyl-accepting protein methylase
MSRFSQVQKDLIFEVAHQLVGLSPSFRPEVVLQGVAQRMTHLSMTSLTQYIQFAFDNQTEKSHLISCLTIHTTQWFRDQKQLTELELNLENLAQSLFTNQPKVRILSAGCSSGQEVYTLALIFEQLRHKGLISDYSVVGVDIDPI